MPLYEEKFISPLAVRFSQERARPTFQDGRLVSRSLAQIQAVDWPCGEGSPYDVLLLAPFPTIEIIRWQPKLRDEDGEKCLDEDGKTIMGDSCWFTLDNRRLYCLQAAAANVWPKRAACIVHVMHDLPLSKTCPKKFRTQDLGFSVRLARRNDQFNSRAVWSWKEATSTEDATAEELEDEDHKRALKCVEDDAVKDEWSHLIDVPADLPNWNGSKEDATEVFDTAASAAALTTPLDPSTSSRAPTHRTSNKASSRRSVQQTTQHQEEWEDYGQEDTSVGQSFPQQPSFGASTEVEYPMPWGYRHHQSWGGHDAWGHAPWDQHEPMGHLRQFLAQQEEERLQALLHTYRAAQQEVMWGQSRRREEQAWRRHQLEAYHASEIARMSGGGGWHSASHSASSAPRAAAKRTAEPAAKKAAQRAAEPPARHQAPPLVGLASGGMGSGAPSGGLGSGARSDGIAPGARSEGLPLGFAHQSAGKAEDNDEEEGGCEQQ